MSIDSQQVSHAGLGMGEIKRSPPPSPCLSTKSLYSVTEVFWVAKDCGQGY